ncbi:fructose-1,6-bisphosphatase/inositol monophosphatase family enzyme [Catenulispora sp. GAS73]|uniref:inositol monophosphatase family protein n=1 Tax=Catenulispora sp. GAS73 TaxID=3156269 RepID=UPI00351854BE
MVMNEVVEILNETAATVVLPRFQRLTDVDVTEKSPGELVTAVDREAEALISGRLRTLLDVPIVGEEAASADPGLLAAVATEPTAWLVDPLDGTANFVAGRPDYAIMVALLRDGRAVASWILQPTTGTLYQAELGSGTYRNGSRVRRSPAPEATSQLRGVVLTGFLDEETKARIAAAGSAFNDLGPGTKAAGIDYPRVVDGYQDFTRYQRTLPWDHAPGALLLTEAGGTVLRLDGAPYQPGDGRTGLLIASDPDCWATVRDVIG